MDDGEPKRDAVAQMGMGTFRIWLDFGRSGVSVAIRDRKIGGAK